MTSGTSFKALQWLIYMEATCPELITSNGERAVMEHTYFRGEKNFHGWLIDGYAFVNNMHIFYEYLGDYYHPGCSECNSDSRKDYVWDKKRQYLEGNGKLIFIRECQFDKLLTGLKSFKTPKFPMIMTPGGKQGTVLNGIETAIFSDLS